MRSTCRTHDEAPPGVGRLIDVVTVGALVVGAAACGPQRTPCMETPGFSCTVAGTGKPAAGADGEPATQSELLAPADVALRPDAPRAVLIVDQLNHRIREIDAEGVIHTVAGTGELGDGIDGPATGVGLANPTGIAFDPEGRLLLAAWQNHKLMRLDADGVLRTIAGTGKRGFSGDGGPASIAQFDLPSHVTTGADGSLILSDQGNNRIRRVASDGVVTAVAGTGGAGFGGEGALATSALLQSPANQSSSPSLRTALLPDGTLLIADSGNHRVRRIDAQGIIRTLAGTGVAGLDGDGGPAVDAQLSRPTDLAVAPDGTVYVADTDNSCIRRISPDGVIDTVAGRCGESGFDGDSQPATSAQLMRPFGIALAQNGDLYIADSLNHRVRVVVAGAP